MFRFQKLMIMLSYLMIPGSPKAFTSLRLSASSPLSIWTMTYVPDMAWPGIDVYQILEHFPQHLLTWDDYVLPISGRSSKMAKVGATRKLLCVSGWKRVWDADFNISSPLPTASTSVENLNSLDGDHSAVVNGNPWIAATLGVANCILAIMSVVRTCSSSNSSSCIDFIANI